MIKDSHIFARRCAGWSLVLLAGLTGLTGCSTESPASTRGGGTSSGPKADPVLQPLVGTWEIDCGNGFVQFKLVVADDYSANFDWQTYTAPGSTSTKINQMDLRLASVNGGAEATVFRADDAVYNGRKMRISAKDADSVVVHGGGEDGVVDMDYTLFRESAAREVDCGGD
jgi:hypothetical protein